MSDGQHISFSLGLHTCLRKPWSQWLFCRSLWACHLCWRGIGGCRYKWV